MRLEQGVCFESGAIFDDIERFDDIGVGKYVMSGTVGSDLSDLALIAACEDYFHFQPCINLIGL
ncbi:hypothetical protein D1872_300320 [compost metagenome]